MSNFSRINVCTSLKNQTVIYQRQFKIESLLGSLFLFCVLFILGCEKKQIDSQPLPQTAEQMIERGQKVYAMNCISCHNADPKMNGIIGPDVSGSSLELLESRILFMKYPAGYKPKRNSGTMVAMPHLKGDIPALHAYLNAKVK